MARVCDSNSSSWKSALTQNLANRAWLPTIGALDYRSVPIFALLLCALDRNAAPHKSARETPQSLVTICVLQSHPRSVDTVGLFSFPSVGFHRLMLPAKVRRAAH